jgi:hypothetical protein
MNHGNESITHVVLTIILLYAVNKIFVNITRFMDLNNLADIIVGHYG